LKDKKNAVVIVVNNNFAQYALALINSIKANWESHPQILLFLHMDVSDIYLKIFESFSKLSINRFDPIQYEYRKLLTDDHSTFGSKSFHDSGYFILNFWNTNFDNYDNLLILDADMLVLKNLDFLINQNSFYCNSAANERLFPVFSFKGNIVVRSFFLIIYYLKACINNIFIFPNQSINSGVILLTPKDRNLKNYNFLLKLLKEFKKACPSDQEIILLWIIKTKKKFSFDFRFNFQIRFFNALQENSLSKKYKTNIESAIKNIHILHFNGIKPNDPLFLEKGWGKNRPELIELYKQYQMIP